MFLTGFSEVASAQCKSLKATLSICAGYMYILYSKVWVDVLDYWHRYFSPNCNLSNYGLMLKKLPMAHKCSSYCTFEFSPGFCMIKVRSLFATHCINYLRMHLQQVHKQINTSSLAILMSSFTPEKTVGCIKYPLSPCRAPPHSSLAPSFFPLSISSRILLNCSAFIY